MGGLGGLKMGKGRDVCKEFTRVTAPEMQTELTKKQLLQKQKDRCRNINVNKGKLDFWKAGNYSHWKEDGKALSANSYAQKMCFDHKLPGRIVLPPACRTPRSLTA